jgi:hypothetical protein
VGIGTSSPSEKLSVAGNVSSTAWIGRANGSAPTADCAIYRATDNTLGFSTASTERMRIDSSGNLLVGTTDSASSKINTRGIIASSVSQYTWSTFDGYTDGNLYITANAGSSNTTNSNIIFRSSTSGGSVTERMRIDSSGNVGIGSSTIAQKLSVAGASVYQMRIWDGATSTSSYDIGRSNVDGYFRFYGNQTGVNGYIWSGIDGERMRIDTSGYLNVGSNVNTNGVQIQAAITSYTGGTTGQFLWNCSGGSQQFVRADIIGGSNYATWASDSGTAGWKIRSYSGGYAYRFEFNSNGAAYNTTGTWGTISDARVKQDVVDANSAWSDIKALAFKRYRLKSDVAFESSEENTKGFVAPTLFGLVAQDVQKTSPGLVEATDSSEVEDGKLLAIKTSVLLMKATKALQEAMERIETLETKADTQAETINALTARIVALEAK